MLFAAGQVVYSEFRKAKLGAKKGFHIQICIENLLVQHYKPDIMAKINNLRHSLCVFGNKTYFCKYCIYIYITAVSSKPECF